MRKLLLSISFAFLALPALAAGPLKISGKVVDAQTKEPVPGAIVRLDENYLWAVTDAEGVFLLSGAEKGQYVLQTDCLGYNTSSLSLKLDKSLEGFLAFSVEHQEPAVGLIAAAQRDDILLRQPAQSVVPAFFVEGPEAFDSVEVRLRVFAEQFREHLDLALVGPGYQLINHGNIVL